MAENQYLVNTRRKEEDSPLCPREFPSYTPAAAENQELDQDITEENRRNAFENYLRENHIDEDTITKLLHCGVDSLLDLFDYKASWWNDISSTGKQKLQNLLDFENDYSDLHWVSPPKENWNDLDDDLRTRPFFVPKENFKNKYARSSRNRDHSHPRKMY